MEQEKNFYIQLEILAQLPSQEGRDRAVNAVFGAFRHLMDTQGVALMETSLPLWLKARWNDIPVAGDQSSGSNLVDLIKTSGNYTYRGAAERVLKGILSSLVEVLDSDQRESFQHGLPKEVVPFWEQANSCSLNATAGQFL
jgi:uncharacterized protein (DUF2267 family)